MFEAIVRALIAICLMVAVGYLVIFVLGALGLMIPGKLITIFWIIIALIAILILYRIFRPFVGGWLP